MKFLKGIQARAEKPGVRIRPVGQPRSEGSATRLSHQILFGEHPAVRLRWGPDGSLCSLRVVFIAYMSGALSEKDCAAVEDHLRQARNIRCRSHWESLFSQFEDELVERAMGRRLGEDVVVLTDEDVRSPTRGSVHTEEPAWT